MIETTDAIESGGAGGSRRVPLAAKLLGGAGLLPPAIAIVTNLSATGSGDDDLARFAIIVGLTYVSLILSFLGGAWWGLAARLPGPRAAPWLAVAVVPSLLALAIQVSSAWFPGPSVVLLAVVVAATPLVDARLAAAGLAPRWWMRLRLVLSLGLGALTLVLAALI